MGTHVKFRTGKLHIGYEVKGWIVNNMHEDTVDIWSPELTCMDMEDSGRLSPEIECQVSSLQ